MSYSDDVVIKFMAQLLSLVKALSEEVESLQLDKQLQDFIIESQDKEIRRLHQVIDEIAVDLGYDKISGDA